MRWTFLSGWPFRRSEPIPSPTALDFGPFPDALYHALSELGSLVTWKWVDKSDAISAGGRQHVIVDVPLYRDLVASEPSPFWKKEATCALRIAFNPQGGRLVSGSRKVAREESPNIQIMPACFKPHDGAPARWSNESRIHPQQADIDAASRQVLQAVVQILELNRHPHATAKLFALLDRPQVHEEPRQAVDHAVAGIEPRPPHKRLQRSAEPPLLEFRGPGLANIKAFKGWLEQTDPASGQEGLRAVFSLHGPVTYDGADGPRATREFHCDEELVDAVLRTEGTQEAYPEAYAQFERAWEERPSRTFERD